MNKFKKGDIVKIIDENFDNDFNYKGVLGIVRRWPDGKTIVKEVLQLKDNIYYIDLMNFDFPCYIYQKQLKKATDREALLYYIHGPTALFDNKRLKEK